MSGSVTPSLYERRAEYWTRDLADRTFELAVKAELAALAWSFDDNTTEHDRPDLYLHRQVRGTTLRAALELKEKRQPYRGRWAELARLPEAELLVLDEVSARKLLAYAPRALLLFWDETRPDAPYVLFSIIDLFCLPKVRVLRPITHHDARLKAKWLLDRRHGLAFPDLRRAFGAIANYLDHDMLADLRRVEAHGPFVGETVAVL
jgi:hypothetical protein